MQTNAATNYPYLIKVNKQQNCITIYKKDKSGRYTVPHKAMICSTGYETPVGTFKTPAKYRWKALVGDVWGQYSTRITGGFLFHSVWYYKTDPSTLSAVQYNKLGTMCSHGCIRITVADAKWIYDNCPIGTTVIIYNSKNPGPLGKPKAIKLKPNMGFDPTDYYAKGNPYNGKKPVIYGAKNRTVKYGQKVNVLAGIKAYNTTGFDATSNIKVSGTVNTKKEGNYKVTYSLTDELLRSVKKTVVFTVKANETQDPVIPDIEETDMGKARIIGVKDQVVKQGTKIDKAFALKNVELLVNNKKVNHNEIHVQIKEEEDNSNVYEIVYEVDAKYCGGDKKTCRIIVDKEMPQIMGVENKEISWDTTVDRNFALKDVVVEDDVAVLTKDEIAVRIVKKVDRYVICYTIQDQVGHKTTKYANFIVNDYLRFTGIEKEVLFKGDTFNKAYALQKVKAYCYDKEVTEDIEVRMEKLNDTSRYGYGSQYCTYEVTYVIKDEKNNDRKEKTIFTYVKKNQDEI